MPMSTFQKVTLVTCLVLCVALLLPKMLLSRGKKDAAQTEAGPGRFPPLVHRQMTPDSQGQRAAAAPSNRAHNSEAMARAKGGGTGAGTGGKSNLAGQIIPIYGFGILVYILYILFKITSKGNTKPTEPRFPSVRSENMKRKITDFELSQLQEKLRETEMVMEKIVSKASHSPERVQGVSADQEEALLLQLREITRVMQEGHLVEGVAPEKKARDWEGFPEEPHQCWEDPFCGYHHSEQQGDPEELAAERPDLGGADQEEGVAYQGEGGADQEEGVAYQGKGGADQEEGVAYQGKGGADQEEGVAYQGEGGADQEEGVAYQGEGGADQEEGVAYQGEGGADQEEGVAYQGEGGADQEEGVAYQGEGGVDLEQDGAVDHMGEAGEAGVLNNKEGEAHTIIGDEEVETKRDVGVSDAGEVVNRRKVGGAESQVGVAADEMGGAELELTLKMSTMQESEEKDTFDRPKETSASRTRVRRRHKKKRTE